LTTKEKEEEGEKIDKPDLRFFTITTTMIVMQQTPNNTNPAMIK
jgi:hypothetical protein